MVEDSKQANDGSKPSSAPHVSDTENPSAETLPQKTPPVKKATAPLLPHDSDFERDPREDDSFADRTRDYLRDKPPHHS